MPLAPLIIFGVQELIKYYPTIRSELAQLLARTDATEADWVALRDKYQRRSYESVVTESGLIPSN